MARGSLGYGRRRVVVWDSAPGCRPDGGPGGPRTGFGACMCVSTPPERARASTRPSIRRALGAGRAPGPTERPGLRADYYGNGLLRGLRHRVRTATGSRAYCSAKRRGRCGRALMLGAAPVRISGARGRRTLGLKKGDRPAMLEGPAGQPENRPRVFGRSKLQLYGKFVRLRCARTSPNHALQRAVLRWRRGRPWTHMFRLGARPAVRALPSPSPAVSWMFTCAPSALVPRRPWHMYARP